MMEGKKNDEVTFLLNNVDDVIELTYVIIWKNEKWEK